MSISLARVYMAVLAALPLWMAVAGEVAVTDALIGTTSTLAVWQFVDPRTRKHAAIVRILTRRTQD